MQQVTVLTERLMTSASDSSVVETNTSTSRLDSNI
jgi:hypothetical protein